MLFNYYEQFVGHGSLSLPAKGHGGHWLDLVEDRIAQAMCRKGGEKEKDLSSLTPCLVPYLTRSVYHCCSQCMTGCDVLCGKEVSTDTMESNHNLYGKS